MTVAVVLFWGSLGALAWTHALYPLAVALATIPEKIRGFGPVKSRHLTAAKAEEAALLERFRSGQPEYLKAAE